MNAWIDRYQPELVLCGHVHESPWANGGGWCDQVGTTWIVNAGRERGAIPPHVVIDTETRQLRWVSSDGGDEMSFAAPQYSG